MRPLDILSLTLVLCATALVLALPLDSDNATEMARQQSADHRALKSLESGVRTDRHLFGLDDLSAEKPDHALYSGASQQEGSRRTGLHYSLSDRVYRL